MERRVSGSINRAGSRTLGLRAPVEGILSLFQHVFAILSHILEPDVPEPVVETAVVESFEIEEQQKEESVSIQISVCFHEKFIFVNKILCIFVCTSRLRLVIINTLGCLGSPSVISNLPRIIYGVHLGQEGCCRC
jgi:hypothetical protein